MSRKMAVVLGPCLLLASYLPGAASDLRAPRATGPYDVGEYDDGFGGNWDGDFPPYHPYATMGFGIVYRPEYSEAGHYGYAEPPRFVRPWHRPRITHRKCRCHP